MVKGRGTSPRENFWVRVDHWNSVNPAPQALAFLETLHETIYSLINQDYQFRDEQNRFSIGYGPFQMRFDCEQGPIEWSTVAAIVDYFHVAAARGHLGLYRVQFLQISGPAIISVSLGLFLAAGAAY